MQYLNHRKIAILLSTYNGEKYLPELLESIVVQSCQDFTLYIRDDGSSDSTKDINKEYSDKHDNIEILASEGNLGPKYTFLKMLEEVNSDYVMFCDQDDVWLPTKVADTYDKMLSLEKDNPGRPIIVYTDLRIVNENLGLIAESSWKYHGFNVDLPHSFHYLCHYNDITGCTMMINRPVWNLCQGKSSEPLLDVMYHDWFISLVSAKAGGIAVPLKKQTINYRRHEGSETDALELKTSIIHRLNETGDFFRLQKSRHEYFKGWGYGSYIKFLYYKTKLFILKQWKKK